MRDREASRGEKRQQIIDAAVAIFAQKGYSRAVVANIARQAEIGKGTIYEYFSSKEDLFFAVFEWYLQKTEEAAAPALSGTEDPAAAKLEALGSAIMDLWIEIKDIFALVMEFWAASSSSLLRQRFKNAFRQAYRQFRRRLAALIQEGIEKGEFDPGVDAEAVAASLVGTWDALLLQAWFEDTFDPRETAGRFLEIVIKGMRPKRQ